MARVANRRNLEWTTPDKIGWEHAHIEVLMDIREELECIRRILECPNVTAGFVAMQTINRRLAKKLPLRKKSGAAS